MRQVGRDCWQENNEKDGVQNLSRKEKREKLEGSKGFGVLEGFFRLQKRCSE